MDLPIGIEQVVQQKLKPQIEAMQLNEDEAREYVQNYINEAGSNFQTSIQSQIDQTKSQFQSIVQKITTLATSLIAIPTIMANPMTVSVANQTLTEVMGNIKSVNQDISSLTSKIREMVGSVPGVMDNLQEQANSVQEEAESSLHLVNLTVDGQERDIEDTSVVISDNTGNTTIIWGGITPATHIGISYEGDLPTGVIPSVSETTLTIQVNHALFSTDIWAYSVEVEYQESDGMDDSGNIQYTSKTKEYTGTISR